VGSASVEEVLARPVFAGDAERRFGELSVEQVEDRAAELRGASGFGHGGRVGAVAAAWRELALLMRANDAATVADLDGGEVAARAEALWVLPPGGSLLP